MDDRHDIAKEIRAIAETIPRITPEVSSEIACELRTLANYVEGCSMLERSEGGIRSLGRIVRPYDRELAHRLDIVGDKIDGLRWQAQTEHAACERVRLDEWANAIRDEERRKLEERIGALEAAELAARTEATHARMDRFDAEELERARAKRREYRAMVDDLVACNDELEKERARLSDLLDAARARHESSEAEVRKAHDLIFALEAERDQALSDAAGHNAAATQYEKDLRDLRAAYDAAADRVLAARSSITRDGTLAAATRAALKAAGLFPLELRRMETIEQDGELFALPPYDGQTEFLRAMAVHLEADRVWDSNARRAT